MVATPVFKVINPDPLQQFRYHFNYAEDMHAGKLVRISADETVSHTKAGGGDVLLASTGADAPVGICLHNRDYGNLLENSPLVDVWLFGPYSAVVEVYSVGTVAAGSYITLDNGHKALVIKGGDADDLIRIII